MTRITLGIVLLSATAIFATAPSQAQNGTLTRSFVSSTGVDGNPCTITAPCASFAHAYTKIAANGIIAALDPGKYGPLTIIGPVTVNGNGWAAITAPASGDGIIVNANTAAVDNVTLSGIEIDGAGAGYNGIVFNSGGKLTVSNCLVKDFLSNGTFVTGNGILIAPNTSDTFDFDINNTVVANNPNVGLYYYPPGGAPHANIIVDHVAAKGNDQGMRFDTAFTSASATNVAVSNSVASNNSGWGIVMSPNTTVMTVAIDNTVISGNAIAGIAGVSTVHVLLGRSVITGNGAGISNETGPHGNTFYSYGDNRINGNATDIAAGTGDSPLTTIQTQ